MLKLPLKSLFRSWRRTLHRQARAGFTLVELLVTALIAGLITSGLLGLVYELLQTNQRDTVRGETQRDMQMALDFISAEIREAVYVYDGECLDGNEDRACPGIFSPAISPVSVGDNTVPIFALWKLEELPDAVKAQCANNSAPEGTPCLAGQSHILVIYALRRNQDGEIWEGSARILRYEHSQFNSNGAPRNGYVSPIQANCSYANWPCDRSVGQWPSPAVLVDFVHDRWVRDLRDINEDGNPDVDAVCPDNSDYVLTPSNDTLNTYGFGSPGSFVRNFYGCVRLPPGSTVAGTQGQLDDADDDARFNQKVILFLRGNIDGRLGSNLDCQGLEDEEGANTDHFCLLPAIETQVVNRGVLNKEPFSLQ